MDEEVRKYLAFLAGMVFKVANGEEVSISELRSLDNIMCELDFWDLDEREFR